MPSSRRSSPSPGRRGTGGRSPRWPSWPRTPGSRGEEPPEAAPLLVVPDAPLLGEVDPGRVEVLVVRLAAVRLEECAVRRGHPGHAGTRAEGEVRIPRVHPERPAVPGAV